VEKLLVIGTGGHAKIVIDIIESAKKYEIIGITTKDENLTEFYGYPVLGNDDILMSYKDKGINNVALGVGGYRDNELRTKIYNRIKSQGFNAVNIVHPTAVICSGCSIGEGSVIFPGVVINTEVKIGTNVIVATSSSIDHETVIEDNVLISAGVTVGGACTIKSGTLIGLGAKIISGITIGNNVLIGAGSVVVKDLIEVGTYIGIPAKKVE
jgi:sugar O-acyltransferase (sialic acid O-acetyltransferase NeuD family)